MNIVKKGINVSFYLLTPDSKSQSIVYCSISRKGKVTTDRLRFSTGESFITQYCHQRTKKGKDLLRRNTTFFLEYKLKLESIRNSLIKIEQEIEKQNNKFTLEAIRDKYYLQAGLIAPPPLVTFENAFNSFISESTTGWSGATLTKVNSALLHFSTFGVRFGEIELQEINLDLWNKLRDEYFVSGCKFGNNTTNKYLSFFKQFLRYAKRKGFLENNIDFEAMRYLDEIEPFKIALKLHEVEALINIDLTSNDRLDRVRDLFVLEIMTGQRFSDIPALLNKNNISDTAITIYQQKTNEKVNIPLHPKLKTHLKEIFDKYPEGLPVITNQKFNEYLKELCIKIGLIQQHTWITLTGKAKIKQTDFRHNLVSSHTGRRTFATLALSSGINAETVMKVTGHRKYEQFREYVKVDDTDVNEAFENNFMNGKK